MPPLSPNTNVPTRLRTSSSVGSNPRRTGTTNMSVSSRSCACVPRQAIGRARRRLARDAASRRRSRASGWITGAKRGLWLVGSSLSRPSAFALRVRVRVGAADEPEHRRHVPLGCRTSRSPRSPRSAACPRPARRRSARGSASARAAVALGVVARPAGSGRAG